MMKPFSLLLAVAMTLLSLSAVRLHAKAKRPNVVIFLTDDQSWDSLGYMGGKVYTPTIDVLAREGMVFSNFNVTSTVCSPSRYSFLTGRYAGNCKGKRFLKEHPLGEQTQVENIGEVEPDLMNLPKALREGGYRTGFVGKSHVVRHDLIAHGSGGHHPRFRDYLVDADPIDLKVSKKLKFNHEIWKEEIKKMGFDYADGIYPANTREYWCEAVNNHNLDWTVSKAIDFLESDDGEKPFFLCFSTTLHHGPAPWVNRFSLDADPKMTPEGYFEEGFDVLPSRNSIKARNRKAGFKDQTAYALWLDEGVKALVNKLEDRGMRENTIFIFVSDHGSYRHGKATLHDYGMRVPMLVNWPAAMKEGRESKALLANIDLAPTLLDLCGVEFDQNNKMDGISFAETLLGKTDRQYRDVLFGELGHSRAVKTLNWKYIAIRYPEDIQNKIDRGQAFPNFKGDGELDRPYLTRNGHLGHYASKSNPHYFTADQLYSLKNDPEENDNVYDHFSEVAKTMKKKLGMELAKFKGRPFGDFNSDSSSK
jgi:arylsulfatase A-like enzyme